MITPLCAGLAGTILLLNSVAHAADYPTPKEADWIARDFKFHTGEVMPELRLHYTTIGEPSGQPVMILHGTGSSAKGLLTPQFAGELFGPGAPLDASKYFIILPDAIGHGGSLKPSDGLRMKFPQYDYADMVEAEYRLIKEGLGIRHLRLIMGNSMGGMETWLWGETHPDVMDALVPMASQPTPIASRNWMLRRLMIETIRNDPDYKNGDYTAQPRSMKYANALFSTATSGGTMGWQARAGTHAEADKAVDRMLEGAPNGDANDTIYQFDASRDYDPEPGLDRIKARVLAVNSADDERNPHETGVMDRLMRRLAKGRYYLIPASTQTRGHGTTGQAALWKDQLAAWLAQS